MKDPELYFPQIDKFFSIMPLAMLSVLLFEVGFRYYFFGHQLVANVPLAVHIAYCIKNAEWFGNFR